MQFFLTCCFAFISSFLLCRTRARLLSQVRWRLLRVSFAQAKSSFLFVFFFHIKKWLKAINKNKLDYPSVCFKLDSKINYKYYISHI